MARHTGQRRNIEETKILEHFKAFFEAHGTSRFESLTVIRHPDGEVIEPRIHNRVGYYDPDERIYLVSSTMFKQEMCIGINEATAKRYLKQMDGLSVRMDAIPSVLDQTSLMLHAQH